jgi:hypothetical protein
MFKVLALLLTLIFALPASAQIYEWRDADGKINYSDRPPPGVEGKLIRRGTSSAPTPAPAPAAQPAKTLAEQELEFRERRAEAAKKKEEKAQEKQKAAQRAERCEQARKNLKILKSADRVLMKSEEGPSKQLRPSQRKAETERTQKIIDEDCK